MNVRFYYCERVVSLGDEWQSADRRGKQRSRHFRSTAPGKPISTEAIVEGAACYELPGAVRPRERLGVTAADPAAAIRTAEAT